MTIRQQQRQITRLQIRAKRRAISPEQQRNAANALTERVLAQPQIAAAKTVSAYLSFDGEIDTLPLIKRLWQQGKTVVLPLLHPFSQGHLLFQRYQPDTEIRQNQQGTLEPKLAVSEIIPLAQLDILFIPLVAFDQQGQRLGMGGGFYDRTLQNWQQHNLLPIGLAHDCQCIPNIPVEAWDIPLPLIITPTTTVSNLTD
jgi:5-formyltetrahydrofolate cyclo-ligase